MMQSYKIQPYEKKLVVLYVGYVFSNNIVSHPAI